MEEREERKPQTKRERGKVAYAVLMRPVKGVVGCVE
jgi:hypothetical protein